MKKLLLCAFVLGVSGQMWADDMVTVENTTPYTVVAVTYQPSCDYTTCSKEPAGITIESGNKKDLSKACRYDISWRKKLDPRTTGQNYYVEQIGQIACGRLQLGWGKEMEKAYYKIVEKDDGRIIIE